MYSQVHRWIINLVIEPSWRFGLFSHEINSIELRNTKVISILWPMSSMFIIWIKFQIEMFDRNWILSKISKKLRIISLHDYFPFINSPKPWRVLSPSFLLPFFLFRLLPISPFNSLLPWPNLSQMFFLPFRKTQLGSASICFCFTLCLSGILSPKLASFSPKPIGHVGYSFSSWWQQCK